MFELRILPRGLSVIWALIWALIWAMISLGCSWTFAAVNPRPTVSVSGNAPNATLDLSVIEDRIDLDNVHITEVHRSLENGFRNVTNARFRDQPGADTVTLQFLELSAQWAQLGSIGRYINLRYRAAWFAPDGTLIAETSGTAGPRNPSDTSARHVEDAFEVMYGQIFHGLDEASRR